MHIKEYLNRSPLCKLFISVWFNVLSSNKLFTKWEISGTALSRYFKELIFGINSSVVKIYILRPNRDQLGKMQLQGLDPAGNWTQMWESNPERLRVQAFLHFLEDFRSSSLHYFHIFLKIISFQESFKKITSALRSFDKKSLAEIQCLSKSNEFPNRAWLPV